MKAPTSKPASGLTRILTAAEHHGRDDDPDHEVGDLQDALGLCWKRLGPRAREAVLRDYFEDHPDEKGRLDDEE